MATVSIYDICSHIRAGLYVPNQGGPGRGGLRVQDSVAAGLQVRKPPAKSGLVQLTPEQAAGVLVEQVSVNGSVDGYQRDTFSAHAKKIAAEMEAGKDVAEVTLAVEANKVFAVDGQHRLAASVISRKPIWAVIRPMGYHDRRERFASQNKSRRVAGDVIVLAASDPISKYVQQAVSGDVSNPWSAIVGIKTSDTKISPALATGLIQTYAMSQISSKVTGSAAPTAARTGKFDRAYADELFTFITVFGSKRTNTIAFKPAALKAITNAAVMCVRRSDDPAAAASRWVRHMVEFPWAENAWHTKERDMRAALIRHWNKRLNVKNKVRED